MSPFPSLKPVFSWKGRHCELCGISVSTGPEESAPPPSRCVGDISAIAVRDNRDDPLSYLVLCDPCLAKILRTAMFVYREHNPPMTPYWSNASGALYCGDWLEFAKTLPDASVDLILTDPPYGLNYNQDDMASHREAYSKVVRLALRGPFPAMDDKTFFRASKYGSGSFDASSSRAAAAAGGGPQPIFAEMTLAMDRDLEFVNAVVWAKPGLGMGLRYRRSYEFMLVAKRPGAPMRWNAAYANRRASNVVTFPKILPTEKQHPTQKPEELMAHFMTLHSFPGDLVFDPWSGSGTTAVVAEHLQRRWMACEIQEDFCNMSIPASHARRRR